MAGPLIVYEPAQAIGSIIVVDTTADNTTADGFCSLREAIIASNNNATVDTCGPGTGDDAIFFNLGSGNPQINIFSPLPLITAPVTINGATGGATRVVLHRGKLASSGHGLNIQFSATGTTIRGLVINNMSSAGINVFANNVTIAGNFIGTDASGTVAMSNGDVGINASNMNETIGGIAGTTPGGACTGDCNLISGNTGAGLVGLRNGSGVLGNFIGVDVTGTASLPNGGDGVVVDDIGVVIGSTNTAGRNVISGNTGNGVVLSGVNVILRGNFIGTNSAGTAALGNGGNGVSSGANSVGSHTIGGLAAGAGNLISGNGGSGIVITEGLSTQVYGNLIGTDVTGLLPVPNQFDGLQAGPNLVVNNINLAVGNIQAGGGNLIAFNGRDGVRVDTIGGVVIRGNSIHDNVGRGIENINGGNGEFAPPLITIADHIIGGLAACSLSCFFVDIYADGADEGKTYLGSSIIAANGQWQLPVPAPGPHITATVVQANPGGGTDTSEFSAAVSCPDFNHNGRCDAVDDIDHDGIVDALDNCMLVPNPNQRDTDNDGYGNRCDADFNNNGFVNAADLALFKSRFGTNDVDADLDGSGFVNAADLAIFKSLFGKAPGPSGFHR